MIRISKMTDYATVLLAELARAPQTQQSAATLAERTQIAVPTVSKALKALQRAGLVRSTRGLHGGYTLARSEFDGSSLAVPSES